MHTDWRSYHIFYHGDRRLALAELVHPVVGSLLSEHLIRSFFYIFYPLGGPHIRLRLHMQPGSGRAVEDRLSSAAREFFERKPSKPLPNEDILRSNQVLLADDPNEQDPGVCPNDCVLSFPFQPETDRYGGPGLLDHSLDFFALSSVAAIDFLLQSGSEPRSRQLASMLRLLIAQAWGFARSSEEFLALLGFQGASAQSSRARVLARGDQEFERSREDFCRILRNALEGFSETSMLAEAARRLRSQIRSAPLSTIAPIQMSQMHMTANRLGLQVAEEIYLSRILWRAARDLKSSDEEFWSGLEQEFHRRAEPQDTLKDLMRQAFAELFQPEPVHV
jgi:hypothetical protein